MFFSTKCLSVVALLAPLAAAQIKGGKLPDRLAGPSTRDKVAIVGGGAAGIHMAHLLKSNGFRDVVVYEESNSIGGQAGSFSARDANGNSVDSGAWFVLGKEAYPTTWKLLEYVGLEDDAVPAGTATVYEPSLRFLNGSPMVPGEYWAGIEIYQLYSDSEKQKLARIYDRWCRSRRSCRDNSVSLTNNDFRMFIQVYMQEVLVALDMVLDDEFESDEMYQKYSIPSFLEDTKDISTMTSDEFFDSLVIPPEIEPLLPYEIMFSSAKPIYDLMLSTIGYGNGEEIPAYYFMSILDPTNLMKVLDRSSSGSSPEGAMSLLKGGYADLFEKLVEKDGIEVKTSTQVTGIAAGRRGGFTVTSKDNNLFGRGRESSDSFDFVISAIDAAQFSSLIQDADTSDIDAAMSCTVSNSWRVSSARITYEEKVPTQTVINMPAINAARDDDEGKVRGPVSVLNMEMAKNGATEEEYLDTQELNAVLYEINFDSSVSPSKVFDDLDFMTVDRVNESVIYPKTFVRSLDFTSCSPWQVLSLQGKDNIWYVGGTVTLGSIETVLQYNNMIVDKFCADSGECRA